MEIFFANAYKKKSVFAHQCTHFFLCKNMFSGSEPREEIEIATDRITTMFLNFGKSEPQRSYKKKKVYPISVKFSFRPEVTALSCKT